MSYSRLLAALLLVCTSACVELSPAGAHVQVITEDQAAQVAQCRHIGDVSVSSKDALRNASAALSGDTVIISRRDVGTSSYIKGAVYTCSNSPATTTLHAEELITKKITTEDKTDAEFMRKSKQCQAKGGAWISNQCVISIE